MTLLRVMVIQKMSPNAKEPYTQVIHLTCFKLRFKEGANTCVGTKIILPIVMEYNNLCSGDNGGKLACSVGSRTMYVKVCTLRPVGLSLD